MRKAENKHSLIPICALAVFLVVFSLLTSPALAIDDAKCDAWAKEIKGRVEDIKDDPDFPLGTPTGNTNCPNLCLVPDPEDSDYTVNPYLRQPAGVLAAIIIDILNSPGDTIFIPGQFGTAAFFCANGTRVVSSSHPAPTACGTAFTEICRLTPSP